MKVNNWNINTLKERLKYYRNLLNKSKNNDERMKLFQAVNALEEYIDEFNTTYKTPKYQHIAKIDREQADNYQEFLPIILDSNEYLIKNNIHLNDQLQSINISKDKILTTTRDFYYEINDIFLEKYLDYYENNGIYINFNNTNSDDKYSGVIRCVPGFNECYINIYLFNNIYDITTSIHEHGHAIAAAIKDNHLRNPYLNEVEGIFFELAYLDSIDYDEFTKEQVLNTKEATVLTYNEHIYSIGAKYLTSLQGIKKKKKATKIIQDTFSIDSKNTKYLLSTSLDYYTNYAISFLIAIELLQIYKKNQYAALKLLKNIISINTTDEKEILSELKSMGIHPGKNLAKFYNNYLGIKSTSKSLH